MLKVRVNSSQDVKCLTSRHTLIRSRSQPPSPQKWLLTACVIKAPLTPFLAIFSGCHGNSDGCQGRSRGAWTTAHFPFIINFPVHRRRSREKPPLSGGDGRFGQALCQRCGRKGRKTKVGADVSRLGRSHGYSPFGNVELSLHL